MSEKTDPLAEYPVVHELLGRGPAEFKTHLDDIAGQARSQSGPKTQAALREAVSILGQIRKQREG